MPPVPLRIVGCLWEYVRDHRKNLKKRFVQTLRGFPHSVAPGFVVCSFSKNQYGCECKIKQREKELVKQGEGKLMR